MLPPIVSTELGIMMQVHAPQEIPQHVSHCTTRGGVLWGVDFEIPGWRQIALPLVVYIDSPFATAKAAKGVQAYGTVTKIVSYPAPAPPTNADLVPPQCRGRYHRTWLHFDEILNVSPAVPESEFFTKEGRRLGQGPGDSFIFLGPPYPKRP